MKKRFKISMILIVVVLGLLTIAGCNNSKTIGIEITSQPTKLVYEEGELFDPTGLEVQKILEDESKVVITNYTTSKTTALTVSDKEITITYGDFSAKISITVNAVVTVEDVEIEVDEEMISAGNLALSAIRYRAVYSDGTKDEEWSYVTDEDLIDLVVEDENINLNLSLFVKNKLFEKMVSISIGDQFLTVSELLTKPLGETYILEGILVAIATTMTRVEYIVLDHATGAMIGITGMAGSTGKINDYTLDTNGYEVGDKIRVPVQLVDTGEKVQNSDSNKIYAQLVTDSFIKPAVLSKNNDYTIDKSTAISISTQEELTNFLSAENRSDNFYKIVKLGKKINFVYYAGTNSGARHYRFFLDDGISTLTGQKIDNCSPCFANGSQYYTTNKTIGEMIFGDSEYLPTSWKTPASAIKEIYAVFIGGNTYYHEFVILSEDDISDPELALETIELVGPTTTTYSIGQEFDLTGAKLNCTYEYSQQSTVDVTLEMLNADTIPDMTTAGKYLITGSYLGKEFSFEIEITAKIVSSIVLETSLIKTEYHIRNWQAEVIQELQALKLLVTYADNTTELLAIEENMISFDDANVLGNHEVLIEYLGKEINVSVTVENQEGISVTTIKTKPAGEIVYELQGVIISSAYISGTLTAPLNGEILLKDKETNQVIGLKNMGISNDNPLAGFAVGDEILVQVTIVVTSTAETHSENGKLAASKVADSEVYLLSSGNNAKIDLASATVIDTQEKFTEFLADDTARQGNVYKLVKICAGARFVSYNNSMYISFIDGTKANDIKIDGLSPFLHIMNQEITLGSETYLNLLFGPDATAGTFAKPNILEKDVYLMYIGGQGAYYHQFILLGPDYANPTITEE